MMITKTIGLGRSYNMQNRQEMDKELQEKPWQAENQVERKHHGICWCRIESATIKSGKDLERPLFYSGIATIDDGEERRGSY